jgi:5-methylcytosine-specific restriction protein A
MGRIKALPPRVATVAARVQAPAKGVDPFYESNAWREFAREIKRQRGYRCEAVECGRDCSHAARGLIADHVVERRDGGADFDPLNVMLLCTACHNSKTARERRRRQARPV